MKSWNPISLVWDWHRSRIIRHSLEQFIPFSNLKHMRVLDVGCGRNKLYTFSLGVDHKKYPCVDEVMDLWNLSELPNCFDVVLLLQVLEHVDCPEKLLDLVAEKSKAFVVVDIPNCDSWLWRAVWRLWRGLGMAQESEHRELTRARLLDLLARRFHVLDAQSYWFGMLTCAVGLKYS